MVGGRTWRSKTAGKGSVALAFNAPRIRSGQPDTRAFKAVELPSMCVSPFVILAALVGPRGKATFGGGGGNGSGSGGGNSGQNDPLSVELT
jgi:hypothetical protein